MIWGTMGCIPLRRSGRFVAEMEMPFGLERISLTIVGEVTSPPPDIDVRSWMLEVRRGRAEIGLPTELKSLFWDCDFTSVRLDEHRNFVIRRVIDRGDWTAITWLRLTVGDEGIRDWFLLKNGGRLDQRKLRFWGLILDLPRPDVDEWVRTARSSDWRRGPTE